MGALERMRPMRGRSPTMIERVRSKASLVMVTSCGFGVIHAVMPMNPTRKAKLDDLAAVQRL